MLNLKDSEIYIYLKNVYFSIQYLVLNLLGIKNDNFYISKWVFDNISTNKLTDYKLSSKSVVIDVGGYHGVFTDKINRKYHPNIIVFEPIKSYYNFLTKKFKNDKNVTLLNYGLSNKKQYTRLYISDDGTSQFKKSNRYQVVKLISILNFVEKYNKIDLLSINAEGAEYDILDTLTKSKKITKIKNIQVQFHSFVKLADKRRSKIIRGLLKTHSIKYSYPFVWESFTLK